MTFRMKGCSVNLWGTVAGGDWAAVVPLRHERYR